MIYLSNMLIFHWGIHWEDEGSGPKNGVTLWLCQNSHGKSMINGGQKSWENHLFQWIISQSKLSNNQRVPGLVMTNSSRT